MWTTRLAHAVLVALAAVAACGKAAEIARNDQAIAEVLAGKRTTARASWWGYHPDDATAALQAAIRSKAARVVVEKMPGPWIVESIELAGDQEVFFEPGAVVLAKKGSFRGPSDALFRAVGKSNVKLTGPGATLQMRRADYAGPPYAKAEWRHVLSICGCTNVTITGLVLAESGGDGIYLGAGPKGQTNRNVTIREVTCDRNYRQGISVITAEGLLIENCTLKDTAGTPPAAGIDFEPNHASERLVDCVMRRCVIENNQGYALHIYARPLDGTSAPVSIRVEDCITRGTNARSASIVTSCGKAGPVKGTIEFVNCRFEDVGHAGVNIGSKPPGGATLRFVRTTIADPAERPAAAAPILFSARPDDLDDVGGVEFVDCTLVERVDRPLMKFDDRAGVRVRDLRGTLVVRRGKGETIHRLDQTLVDRWMPTDPIYSLRPVLLDGARFEPMGGGSAPATRALPAHRLRGEALYLLTANQGETVSLRLAHEPVGRSEGKPLVVRVTGPSGKEVQQGVIDFRKEGEVRFTAAESGVFHIACRPATHTVRLLSSSHRVCIAGQSGRIHLLGTTGEFYFDVPPGTREFGIRLSGEGEAERVSAAIFDAAGVKRWERLDIAEPQSFRATRDAAAQGEIWRLRLARPTAGVLEDCTIEFRGIPAILGWDAQGLVRPRRKCGRL
ncbi:MAG: right-handed parallel beta-helix repeat-containing protein [Thermoguttaceae bacterium]|jgi:hypothetical protein|nr:right-handed parallel beta-helix repeat-containing protein [Thermoguttaceae bacterium]